MRPGGSAGGSGGRGRAGVRTVSGGFIAARCQPIREERRREKHFEGQRKECAQRVTVEKSREIFLESLGR